MFSGLPCSATSAMNTLRSRSATSAGICSALTASGNLALRAENDIHLLAATGRTTEETLSFEDLTLNPETREVTRGTRSISLTRTEFALMEMLMANPRRVLTRSRILEEVWGYDFPTSGNALEVYVGYLRRKTEAEGEPRLIHTVRGVGYVLRETPP